MAVASIGYAIHGGQSRDSVTFDFASFESLPDVKLGVAGVQWTEDMDAALLKYWTVKRQCDVAKLLGVSEDTARKRYRELTCQKSR